MTNGPLLFDIEDDARKPGVTVADAPPVPETAQPGAQGDAMRMAARIAAGRPSRLGALFWALALAVLGAVISVGVWELVTGLMARAPLVGWAMTALVAAFLLVCVAVVLRELAAIGRLRRVDGLRRASEAALYTNQLSEAQALVDRLIGFYADREETRWGRDRLAERRQEILDTDALLALAEDELLAPLDAAARREVEAAARQVAAVTALVPLALADVAAALASSIRMIRRVAEVYGGRSGLLGSWRLTRAVFAHLVATGAVAVGDDLLEPVLGGSVLSKLSRRFGEGIVNGALTARVGVAAMDVCRPIPFSERHKPSVRSIVAGAMSGLFSRRGA